MHSSLTSTHNLYEMQDGNEQPGSQATAIHGPAEQYNSASAATTQTYLQAHPDLAIKLHINQ